jgi:hypothetical protein
MATLTPIKDLLSDAIPKIPWAQFNRMYREARERRHRSARRDRIRKVYRKYLDGTLNIKVLRRIIGEPQA